MVKRNLKINIIFFGIIIMIILVFWSVSYINNYKSNINTENININSNINKGTNYTYKDYTKIDICKTGCNLMDYEYTKDYNINHNNIDNSNVVNRLTICYDFCKKTYN